MEPQSRGEGREGEEREPPHSRTLPETVASEAAAASGCQEASGEENQSSASTSLDESSSAPAADFDTAAAATGLRQRVPPSRRAVNTKPSSSSSAATRPARRGRTRKGQVAADEVPQKKDLLARVGGALTDSVKSVGARMFLMLILVIVGLIIAAIAAFAFCWAFFPVATTPIAGLRALASLETVTLGGVEQSILLRAEDTANPIVLLLHGGPGLPLMPFREGFAALEKDFLVVYWDQYGSGKSCEWSTFLVSPSSSSPSASLSTASAHDHHHRSDTGSEESTDDNAADDGDDGKPAPSRPAPCRRCRAHRHDRFGDFDEEEELGPQRSVDLASTFQDAEELVQYLCRRFHQPAVTLVAHDSGSVVAMRLAQQHPELVRSVFLVAPLIDFGRQHEALLAWALGKARRERQFPILAQLETTAGGRGGVALPLANATQLVKLRRAVADLGGDMRKGGFVLKLLHHAFAASEYSVGDKLTLVPCGIQSAAHQFNDLRQVNLTEQVRAVKVPVGMACGKWDRVTPCAVVEDYLRLLRSAASTASPAPTLGENDDAVAVAPSPETPAEQGAGDVIVFAKSAHWPFIEEGATFAERLREHLSANSNR